MKVRYDEQTDVVYIKFRDAKYHESDEIKEGVILDYDRSGKIVGIEILDASAYLLPKELASIQFEVCRSIKSPKSKLAA